MLAGDHLFLHAYRLASRSLAGLLAALDDACRELGVGQIFSPFKNTSVRAAPICLVLLVLVRDLLRQSECH